MQSLQQAAIHTNVLCVRLPAEEAHHMCHPTKEAAMGISQRTKIHDLVQTGVIDPTVVQCLPRSHVPKVATATRSQRLQRNEQIRWTMRFDNVHKG